MNNHSDYGYAVPQIERRTSRMCRQRALDCLRSYRRDPDARPYWASDNTHRDMASIWLAEARTLRAWERRNGFAF